MNIVKKYSALVLMLSVGILCFSNVTNASPVVPLPVPKPVSDFEKKCSQFAASRVEKPVCNGFGGEIFDNGIIGVSRKMKQASIGKHPRKPGKSPNVVFESKPVWGNFS